jgi:diaminohydroxyphosphoribosylaminopyrimidine deaminase/5-amino-6-(5-phosphoribosylamino)uracil reductase
MNINRDSAYLQMAYGLAEKALGWASPNPYVGAVIVNKDQIVGYGYHERPGKPHAEAVALKMAGKRAKGGTAYITLEPCIHFGRTPPCADSLIFSKIERTVISSLDPNPIVNKKGLKKLKQAGINVSTGLLESRNNRLNEAYFKYITHNIPFLTAKTATTQDGKIATNTMSSKWISSSSTREYVHLLRGEHDAILVGINTIIRDDPILTIRHPNWEGKRLTRVILDSHLRFPLNSKIFQTISDGNILIFCHESVPDDKSKLLEDRGGRVIRCSGNAAGLDLVQVLQALGANEISSVLIEGGSRLMTSFLEKKLIDKMYITISPKLIGGKEAPTFFEGKGISVLRDSLRLKKVRSFTIDEDIIVEGYF